MLPIGDQSNWNKMKGLKTRWEDIDRIVIRENFPNMTWDELLGVVNDTRSHSEQVKLSALRHECRRMGLKKHDLIHWSSADIVFLLKNYKKKGNVELSQLLTERKMSFRVINGKKIYRVFTKKHVEKKKKLLGLSRTKSEIVAIKHRNYELGLNRFITSDDNLYTRGVVPVAEEQAVRIWNRKKSPIRVIKINGQWIHYNRWFYHNFIEPVPPGHIVISLDGDSLNYEPENLKAVPRTGKNSLEFTERANVLLKQREQKILDLLPTLNYDRERNQIKKLHSELNRIRALIKKHEIKIKKIIQNGNVRPIKT